MEDDDPLAALPRAYSLALRLRDAGADEALISECLDIDPSAVVDLLVVAEAKLASARRRRQAGDEVGAP